MESTIFFIVITVCIVYTSIQIFKNRYIFIEGFKLNSNNYIIYLLSLFIPLVGIIVGSIKLSKDDNFNRNIGINCIILSVISIVLGILILKK